MKTLKLIRNDADLQSALARISDLMDAKPGTPEGEELSELAVLVETYEDRAIPMTFPDPVVIVLDSMDRLNITQTGLIPIIGNRQKVSEVLSGKREITEAQAQALHDLLRVPMDVLLMISDAAHPQGTSNGTETKLAKQEPATT